MPRRVLRASATCRAIIGRPAGAGLVPCKVSAIASACGVGIDPHSRGRLLPNEPKPGSSGDPGLCHTCLGATDLCGTSSISLTRCAAREPSAERKEAVLLLTRHLCLGACYALRQHAGLLSAVPLERDWYLVSFSVIASNRRRGLLHPSACKTGTLWGPRACGPRFLIFHSRGQPPTSQYPKPFMKRHLDGRKRARVVISGRVARRDLLLF